MLFLVAFLPLLESVGAASSFANSTISKPATLSTSTATTSSCLYPVTIEPYFQYYDCNRPGDPQLPNTANPYELFFDYSDPFVSQCSSSWDSSFSSWLATVPIITQTSTFSEALDEPEGYIAYTTVLTTQTYVNFGGDFSYTAAAPCCYNCSLYGGDVQVYAWPTPAPTPAVTKLVDSANNFTFTSPSIYVVFNSLYATNLCGHVGKDIPITTLAFDPGQLSTAIAYTQLGGFAEPYIPFTEASFGSEPLACGNVTSSFEGFVILSDGYFVTSYTDPLPSTVNTYCEIDTGNCYDVDWTVVYDPCSPTVSVPSQLFTLNPEWKTCVQGIDAFFDPPYTLTQGGPLSAFSATADPSPSSLARPAITAIAPTPTPTASPDPSPTPDPSTSADPSPSEPSPSADPVSTRDPAPSGASPPADPSTSAEPPQSPDLSPNPSPSSNQGTTAAQSQPQTQPQPTPSTSPLDPNNSIPTPTTTPIPFIIGTQTITPGSPAVTISGTIYSVPSSGGTVIINNSITQAIPKTDTSSDGDATPTFHDLGSQTLIAGGAAITVSSSIILSLLAGGQSEVVEGSQTETLAITAVFTSSPSSTGLGGIIVSIGGFKTPSAAPTSTSVASNGTAVFTGLTFEGRGEWVRGERWRSLSIGQVVVMMGILML